MNRTVTAVLAILLVSGVGAAAWWFSQGTESPSVDVTAPPIETTTTTADVESTEGPTSTLGPDSVAGGIQTYALTDDTQATFTITEELRGTPTTLVGTSTIVLGEIAVDPDDPASTIQIGTILVNARDFATDSANRNRAVRGPILDADSFEFIEFAPTSIDGVDASGGTVTLTVTGDLTIRDVSNPVTFDVTATLDDDGTINGRATASIDRTDWGIDIPSAPGVANVSEEVALALEFVAAPTA